jgi:uncharacterized protein
VKNRHDRRPRSPFPLAAAGLPALGLACWLPCAAAAPAPNCADTSAPVQRLICADAQLTQQDQAIGELYGTLLQQSADADRKRLKARQNSWLTAREACVNGERPHQCLADQQKRRLIELKIGLGQLKTPAAVEYACPGQEATRITARYYPTDPPAALLTFGDRQTVAFIAESASGARYAAGDVEIWEHQGTATFKWGKEQLHCTRH